MRQRLLFIAHRVPYPPDKGERVRAFHEISELRSAFDVTVAAMAEDDTTFRAAENLRRWCSRVMVEHRGVWKARLRGGRSLLNGRSVTEGFFHSQTLCKRILAEHRRRPFDLVMGYCSSTLPYLKAIQDVPRVMDLVDIDSVKWADYAASALGPKRWLFSREARAVSQLEQQCLDTCDQVFTVSRCEADLIGDRADEIVPVGNGVDADYFSPRTDAHHTDAGIVFTGTMDYRPNVEGVCWFAENVWPELRSRHPDLTWTIVGRDPAPAVERLGGHEGIKVTGSVPDVRPFLNDAAVAVVPLRIARGIQNKVLEAMSMGRPVVASPGAMEGIDARLDKEVFRADAPDEWVSLLDQLLENDQARLAVGQAARERIVQSYAWSAQLQPLIDTCLRLTGQLEEEQAPADESEADSSAQPQSVGAGRQGGQA
jgi:sugar transferase (PEP-CTERM/EpsH1 system associated)